MYIKTHLTINYGTAHYSVSAYVKMISAITKYTHRNTDDN